VAQRSHPAVDFLLCTDRVGNHYENAPLGVQPEEGEGRRLGVAVPGEAGLRRRARRASNATAGGGPRVGPELGLEDAMWAQISFNIGILFLYAHAHGTHGPFLDAWVQSVSVDKEGKPLRTLAPWDQEPINRVIKHRGTAGVRGSHFAAHATDRRLARVWGGRLVMGVLPMLQFTTSFTFFIQRPHRDELGARRGPRAEPLAIACPRLPSPRLPSPRPPARPIPARPPRQAVLAARHLRARQGRGAQADDLQGGGAQTHRPGPSLPPPHRPLRPTPASPGHNSEA
jgi:hypothetical protein